jgi:H+/Cl- antiporter ClcA
MAVVSFSNMFLIIFCAVLYILIGSVICNAIYGDSNVKWKNKIPVNWRKFAVILTFLFWFLFVIGGVLWMIKYALTESWNWATNNKDLPESNQS